MLWAWKERHFQSRSNERLALHSISSRRRTASAWPLQRCSNQMSPLRPLHSIWVSTVLQPSREHSNKLRARLHRVIVPSFFSAWAFQPVVVIILPQNEHIQPRFEK